MELKDTVKLMESADYKERFLAEYWQTRIRYQKLKKMIIAYEARKLSFVPTCPVEVLRHQRNAMLEYLAVLETRAAFEKIDLDETGEE